MDRPPTIYAHWLDGEYCHPRSAAPSVLRKRRRNIEGILKLRALFGDRISLSDVQLTDSRIVLELFQDPQFQTFVYREPTFLRLVAAPHEAFGHPSIPTLPCILSGLGRSLNSGWQSSAFSTSWIPRELAKRFKKVKDTDEAVALLEPTGALTQLQTTIIDKDDRELCGGLLNALRHFLQEGIVETYAPKEPAKTYYAVLEESLSRLETAIPGSGDRRQASLPVKSVLQFLKPLSNHWGRTAAIQQLDLSQLPDRRHYSYIVQAWNLGVASTVKPTDQSALALPNAFPLPLLFGNLVGWTAPFSVGIDDTELFERIGKERIGWHPAEVSWATIMEVRKKCDHQIAEYQTASDPAGKTKALRSLVQTLARQIIQSTRREAPAWVDMALDQTGVLSDVLEFVSPRTKLVATAAEHLILLGRGRRFISHRAEVSELADSIRRWALRYNIRSELGR